MIVLLLPIVTPALPAFDNSTTVSSPVHVNETSQTFESARILVDESHAGPTSEIWVPGNASMFGWVLREYGHNVSMNWGSSLDSGILNDYDVLCLFFPQEALTAGEITAIHDFVDAGGSLLLVGVDYTTLGWIYTPDYLNAVSETYGISFNLDRVMTWSLRTADEIEDHHLTYSVQSLHASNDDIYGCSLEVTSPAVSVVMSDEKDFVAYSESGSGRVVAVGSSGPFSQYRRNEPGTTATGQVGENDHFQFSLNVIDWLVGNNPREVDPPELAIIEVGSGPEINSTEIEEYEIFSGVIHEHTTVSDGTATPWEQMLRALEVKLDYFIVTDHSYETPAQNGIVGGIQVKALRDLYNLDVLIGIGAEISRTPHMVGFPMTENIFTTSVQEAVDGIHAQGGVVFLSHPTLSPKHAEPYNQLETIGYEGVEVNNRGYIHGIGEAAYHAPFIASCDTHGSRNLDGILNVLFVRDPTGPNGTLSVDDIVDALLNRRTVILDKFNGLVFGQKVWVDRFMETWDEAETVVVDAEAQLDALELSGEDVGVARLYLADAESSLEHWNPTRAIKLANDAVSDVILGIEVSPLGESFGLEEPHSNRSFSITFTNNLDVGLSVNVTPVIADAVTFDLPSMLVEIGPQSTEIVGFGYDVGDYGYARIGLYVRDYNTTYKPKPIMVEAYGFVPSVQVSEELVEGGHAITILLLRNPGDYRFISSVTLEYVVEGGDAQTAPMENYGNGYGLEIGPFPGETSLLIQITVVDTFGYTYDINYGIYQVEPDEATPGIGMEFILGGVIAAVVVIVLLFRVRTR
ncbi:MAG: hypothetical protein JSW61_14425 [Candidatus Thorarchaeota archaeon]|nr:MAG: hypothetical protein JSW61_14425 [Candidatus Thorarchaeota archaeon]